jgi:hypothetical protein
LALFTDISGVPTVIWRDGLLLAPLNPDSVYYHLVQITSMVWLDLNLRRLAERPAGLVRDGGQDSQERAALVVHDPWPPHFPKNVKERGASLSRRSTAAAGALATADAPLHQQTTTLEQGRKRKIQILVYNLILMLYVSGASQFLSGPR